MSLHVADLIPEPCSEDWNAMVGEGTRRFCERCSKAVVDLSGLSEAELLRVIDRGESQCVQLIVDREGTIVFRATPLVPATRLRARAPATAAVALAVLTACTPHVLPEAPLPEPAPIVAPTAAIVPSANVTSPESPRTYRMGGALLGAHTASPQRAKLEGTVPCDTIAKTSHGRPTGTGGERALLDDRELEQADLLARCDP
ncbi:MAG TPA: hypothetical protein VG755_02165 [Nannocystaceae bacterium]|nr:hypothetical protein [Nannocystaceae bacterium]